MKARDIPRDAFPIALESEGPDAPPVVWGGHMSIVIVPPKEDDGARHGEAAQGVRD